jgi:hypothetical protein
MAMKKTSGGDSPLWEGARKSFWTLPISGLRRWQITMCFWKIDRVFRFFSLGGLDRRRGSVRGGPGGLTHRGRGQGLVHAPSWSGWPLAQLRLLFGVLEASFNIWMFGFCFVQFREYFLCNFSETQKQQKTWNWHCGILLIG